MKPPTDSSPIESAKDDAPRLAQSRLPVTMQQAFSGDYRILGLARPQALQQLANPQVEQWFASDCVEVPPLDTQQPLAPQVNQWIQKHQPDLILMAGGDGTLNLVSQVALQYPLPVILVPGGTANDFAGGLPNSRPTELVWEPVDLVQIQCREPALQSAFVNMLALGCGARHSQDVDPETKATWGSLAYLIQAWQSLIDLQSFRLQLRCDQHQHVFQQAVQLFVANGRTCGGGYCVVDSACYNDGMLDLVVIQQGTPMQIASFLQSYLAGTHLQHELCCHIRAREVHLQMDQPQFMTLDGEPFQVHQAQLDTRSRHLKIAKLVFDAFAF